MISDGFGRSFRTLRISLLDRCNFACTYCVDRETSDFGLKKTDLLKTEEWIRIVKGLHSALDLKKVRLTGGEPTLYPGLKILVREIKNLNLPEVSITTNGSVLSKQIEELKEAGLDSVNISLDGLTQESFQTMSRRSAFKQTLNGIDAAVSTGLKVRINCTLVRGKNEDQIIPILEYSWSKGILPRFLELMKMGYLQNSDTVPVFKQDEILDRVERRFGTLTPQVRKESSTANYWTTQEGNSFGIIANESAPFCRDCDRLRLDSKGNLYGCLSSSTGFPLPKLMEQGIEMEQILTLALRQKQDVRFKGSDLTMMAIGG
ncbi:GTP 3',8-cyclase MoaA [Leptospira yasudae]|uniref:GTP 3',8-cyclase MoaA n=1 Tax=Leptospira yasudae TaxID=2202201 RepID=UPI00108338F2|nr:GTP 3',8-cyclase MoaA [Leptospira yasudae]TGK30494.1 GTP 3',8-cyclase MoaA [Leptospira yasudae]TGM04126.1 GTP 3',8-cyclase MoaA [Leptospira yasudae]